MAGEGLGETAFECKAGRRIVKANERFSRPAEVDLLIGGPSKARTKLGWFPQTGVRELAAMDGSVRLSALK
ncbi:MAG: GDP-mannose 4,6-dehydratase [Alphaproteobacteria bacterium]|nr:GDP-mannose 4,6-dehydratase [Alphaproteobacteria bacterium]